MKLLSGFNAEDMANKLLLLVEQRLAYRVINNPIRLPSYSIIHELIFDCRAEFSNEGWNSRHKQMALLKALILLNKRGSIEIVSL